MQISSIVCSLVERGFNFQSSEVFVSSSQLESLKLHVPFFGRIDNTLSESVRKAIVPILNFLGKASLHSR